MICPVVAYAPTAATKPSIAAQPLKRSASGVIINKINILSSVTGNMKVCKVFIDFMQKKVFYFFSMVRNVTKMMHCYKH